MKTEKRIVIPNAECMTKEQLEILNDVTDKMGDETDESYSPSIYIEVLKDEEVK